uniref:Uncharacterized protein n=1 Tax=Rhizophora mucronata TaxID=61149 RepID=A0A2P2JLU9_RHIMU
MTHSRENNYRSRELLSSLADSPYRPKETVHKRFPVEAWSGGAYGGEAEPMA